MVLGCVFIFICILALFRQRMRKKRAQQTATFAASKNIDARGTGWRVRFASLFSHSPRMPKEDKLTLRVAQLRNLEEECHMAALDRLSTSALPEHYAHSRRLSATGGDTESFYSQITRLPPRAPAPRQPVNMCSAVECVSEARYLGTSSTSAQRYAKSVEQLDQPELGRGVGDTWMPVVPVGTGTSQGSNNPFRR